MTDNQSDTAPAARPRRFSPPWQVEQIPGGFKVLDASGQSLVYVYAREPRDQADIAKALIFDRRGVNAR
jgi:hypothetical protein